MASYATAIKERFDTPVDIQLGRRGQFEIIVDGTTVISRRGGLLALLLRKPWPTHAEVLQAIADRG